MTATDSRDHRDGEPHARNNSEPGSWDIASGIGLTAAGVAAARAVETSRAEPLARDPYGAAFVRAAGLADVMPLDQDGLAAAADGIGPVFAAMTDYMAVRTLYFDDFFLAAAAAGITQVVVLAAGLDARAYRLDWAPETVLYEIDQPDILDFKQRVLDGDGASPRCVRRPVPVDLREDWPAALTGAGFDPSRPSAWLAEGLLPYLPAAVEAELFARVDALAGPGSRLATEYVDPAAVDSFADDPAIEASASRLGADLREMWNGEPRQDAAARLRAAGWTVDAEDVAGLMARHGRSVAGPMDAMAGAGYALRAERP